MSVYPVPGAPALHPTYIPVSSPNGDFLGNASSPGVYSAGLVTPNRTFAWQFAAGGRRTFYKGMPVVVSPADKTAILATGWAS